MIKLTTKSIFLYTAIVMVAVWILLAWDYFHGGVPKHHLLAQKNMPAFSNWWGAFLLPLITFILLMRIKIRLKKTGTGAIGLQKAKRALIGAFIFAIILSIFFTVGNKDIPGYMVMSLFILGFFFPLFRAEYLLGFVLGMTYTFGGVLPLMIGPILLLIPTLIYFFVRPFVLTLIESFRNQESGAEN